MEKKNGICDTKSCFLCKNCLSEWRPAIAEQKRNLKIKKNELIFKEGDPVTGIYFVYSGNVKVFKKWDNEKELILRFAKEGAILGHRGLGKNHTYPISAAALEPAVVCYMDMDFFDASLKVNANFTYQLLMFFADELQESERRMRNLAHMPVRGRFAETLLALKDQFGTTPDGTLNIELMWQDMASYAGATYETIFRVVNELTKEKVITTTGKKIRIIDPEKLIQITAENRLL
jgi:CRP/FNR family transcriptional regulator